MDAPAAVIEPARTDLKGGLAAGVALAEPWENLLTLLDQALEHATAGDKQAALQRVDELMAI
jgi:hypothetical protein